MSTYMNPELPQHPLSAGTPPPPGGGLLGPSSQVGVLGHPDYLNYLRGIFGGAPIAPGQGNYDVGGNQVQVPIMPEPQQPLVPDLGPGDPAMRGLVPHPETGFSSHPVIHPAILAAMQHLPGAGVMHTPPPPSSPMHELTSHDLARLAEVLHGHAQRLFSMGG